MSQDINIIITCSQIDCPYNHEKECGKEVLYINDSECAAQAEKEDNKMREYIDSLEQAGVKMTAEAWKEWINKEIEDLKNQGADNTNIDIDEVIKALDDDGYILDYTAEAAALLESAPLETIATYMDDDIREDVHALLAPCDDITFLAEYLSRHMERYGEEFTI